MISITGITLEFPSRASLIWITSLDSNLHCRQRRHVYLSLIMTFLVMPWAVLNEVSGEFGRRG